MEYIQTFQGTVFAWQCDHMGHMNVMYYTHRFDEAIWHLFAAIGLSPSDLRDGDYGMAAVEQKFEYKRELFPGDLIIIKSKLLKAGDKSMMFRSEMFNAHTDEMVASAETVGVCLDKKNHKGANFPDHVRDKARALLED